MNLISRKPSAEALILSPRSPDGPRFSVRRCGLWLLLALAPAVAAAESAASFHDAFAQGKFNVNLRLRGEQADQAGFAQSEALTLRTRVGFTTAALHGLQGMIEAENIAALNDADAYNAAGTNPGGAGRTVIADPVATQLNQAWLAGTHAGATLKAGRQRLVFDNARFVGDSGWRQNQQTFDAALLTATPATAWTVNYGYVWRVNRVFGDYASQPDFDADAHLLNVAWCGGKSGTLTFYGYRLDLKNSPANSSATYGASWAGAAPLTPQLKLTYRAEIATQSAAAANPIDYTATYRLVEIGAAAAVGDFNVGYEILGSDGGRKGFATPLATLHAFNGWADVFLNTPAAGLRDAYAAVGANFPGGVAGRVIYHAYTSDFGARDYGSEWDAQLQRKFGPRWAVLAKLARYSAQPPYADVERLWLQTEFNF